METKSPSAAAIAPLIRDLPTRPEMTAKANTISANTSTGPILSARIANGAETVISTMSLKVSPVTEEKSAIFVALSGLPCRASGCPSSAVAAESGVPGVLIKIAGMAPPTVPPFATPTRKAIAGSGSSANVKGMAIAIAITGPIPGIAATSWPKATPKITKARFHNVNASLNPARIVARSTMKSPQGSGRSRICTTSNQMIAGIPTQPNASQMGRRSPKSSMIANARTGETMTNPKRDMAKSPSAMTTM